MLSQKSSEASFLFSHKKTLGGGPLFFPFLGHHFPSPDLAAPLLPLSWPPLSSLFAAALYPLHCFLLPLDLLHAARIEKRRSKLD
jgi:hypothetical protein